MSTFLFMYGGFLWGNLVRFSREGILSILPTSQKCLFIHLPPPENTTVYLSLAQTRPLCKKTVRHWRGTRLMFLKICEKTRVVQLVIHQSHTQSRVGVQVCVSKRLSCHTGHQEVNLRNPLHACDEVFQ